jgi:glycosyltransferase involved in cell wall biosynthesis
LKKRDLEDDGGEMKILFLTRVHPPIIGGLENQSYNLVESFKKINHGTFVIKNTRGKKFLPLFLPLAYFKAISLIKKNQITHLHLSDGLLAPLGARIKEKTGVKVFATVHGLDITYKNKCYQSKIPKALNQLDKIICISNATKEECIKRGVNKDKIVVVPNGVNVDEFVIMEDTERLREVLEKKIGITLENKKILLTHGRLVKRKGVEWFINHVMPKLSESYIYLISGDGEERENIKKAIDKNNFQNRVFILGKTNSNILKLLYNSSNLFIMPNIHIEGNLEGFGLVALEAGSCGLPVIASNIEGIPNAIINGKTGWLVKEKDAQEFVTRIKNSEFNKKRIIGIVRENFEWGKIAENYLEVMR